MTDNTDDLDHVTLQHMLWNKYKDPRSSGEDVLSTDTSKVEHLRGIAEQAFCSNAFALAAQHYRDAASILLNHQVLEDESIQDTRELVNLLSQQSECLFRLGKYLEAAEVSEEALSIDPDHVPSLYRHAISNWRGHVPTGKDFGHLFFWASAAKSFERLLELDSNFAHGIGTDSEDDSDSFLLLTETDFEDVIAALTDFKRLPVKKRMNKGRLPPSVQESRQDTIDRLRVHNNREHHQRGRDTGHNKKHNRKKDRESEQQRSNGETRDLNATSTGKSHQRGRLSSSHGKKHDRKNGKKKHSSKRQQDDKEARGRKTSEPRRDTQQSEKQDSERQRGNKQGSARDARVKTEKSERRVSFKTDLEYSNIM